MGGWFETAGVILIVVLGAIIGRICSRLRHPHWGWGYFVPLSLILFLIFTGHPGLKVTLPVLAWATAGRARFVIIGFAVTMGCFTLIGRLKKRLEKAVVCAVMLAIVAWVSVMPFAVPALIKNDLRALKTKIDDDNLCFQSTDFTCGPAAAVTALRRLGLTAQEGEIAVLAHTSPAVGTLPWSLYKAIKNQYTAQGIDCELRRFDSVNQLSEADATLAVVKDAFLVDHCVAVLEVDKDYVTIADPVLGRQKLSHKAFETMWRFYGITLKQNSI
jgi:predicted double-glycine peptidase